MDSINIVAIQYIKNHTKYMGMITKNINEYSPLFVLCDVYRIVFDDIDYIHYHYTGHDLEYCLRHIIGNVLVFKMDEDQWESFHGTILAQQSTIVSADVLDNIKEYIISLFVLIGNKSFT